MAGLEGFQSDLVGDVIKFIIPDGFELLAARLELFVDFDGLLSHHLMRFLRAANQRKIFALGDAFMPVGIQANAE